MNTSGGFATVAHSAHNQIGSANEVATGEYTWDTGHLISVDDYATPFVNVDFVGVACGENRHRIESVSNQNNVDGQTEFGAGNCARFAAAFRIRFSQLHSHTARFTNFPCSVT